MDVYIAMLAGLACGFINTTASSGSALTLPVLIFMGLPPAVANGTNRLPVFCASLVATVTYVRSGIVDWKIIRFVLPPCLVGGLFGVFIAEHIPEYLIRILVIIAVVIALLLLFTRVKQVFERAAEELPRCRWQEAIYLFLAGLWMGLIVLDSATYLLLIMVMSMRLSLLKANAYKNIVLTFGMGISLIIMTIDGNVDWEVGSIMALGSALGGYLGARFSFHQRAKVWTYRFLISMIGLEIIHLTLTDILKIDLFFKLQI